MSDNRFDDRVVLVTGAARGIGRATAEQFARAGARVGLLDIDAAGLETVRGGFEAPDRLLPLPANIADAADVERAVATCMGAFGRLDVLVNNAAVHFARPVDGYTLQEIDLLLGINLKGALFAVRSALAPLRASKGTIVSVSSMTGLVGQANGAVYVATKGALISLTKALALELGPDGIRVNCVCPAGVDTELMRGWAATTADPAATLRGQGAMHLTNRMATPDEIASAILFLASPAAAFITGVALPVEAGATLGYRRG